MNDGGAPVTQETFDDLYQAWLLTDRTDTGMEASLLASYRLAWRLGEIRDRLSVLTFVFFSREANGYELVSEGLLANDELLASHSAAICSGLLLHHCELSAGVRDSLQTFAQRFPKWNLMSDYCLDLLKAQGK